jgi:nifR3 family TIM-barrel protein
LQLNNPLVLAPMAGITNLPFRRLVKALGPGLVYTEMVSANGLIRNQPGTLRYLDSHPDEKPLAVQIFGSEPAVMAAAAERVLEAGADIVDINMGCPARKVVKTGAGGALLRDLRRAVAVASAVRRACPLPLTVKIRAGWSHGQSDTRDLARMLEDCGVDGIAIHPRFVTQGFTGKADWSIIAAVKLAVRIPVIGNGDVVTPRQAPAMKLRTGCDAVMIGRGAVGNPWIFQQALALEQNRPVTNASLTDRRRLIKNHFQLLAEHKGLGEATRAIRRPLLWYTKGLPHSNRFRRHIAEIKDLETLMNALDAYFRTLEDMTP